MRSRTFCVTLHHGKGNTETTSEQIRTTTAANAAQVFVNNNFPGKEVYTPGRVEQVTSSVLSAYSFFNNISGQRIWVMEEI